MKRSHAGARNLLVLGTVAIALSPSSISAQTPASQDIPIGVTYICSGEHIYIENCNIRDTSDNANCMVAHPDHLTPTGLNSYTYVTRGALKKLLPTCQQPSAKQSAAAKAFQQRQQDAYNANVQKAEQEMKAATQPVAPGQPQKPKTPEERQMARCVTSGRLPASCTGNSLLGWFSQAISSVAPGLTQQGPIAGPNLAGVFQGAGNWRLDFVDGGVLVNCSSLSPNQENYHLKFESNRTELIIDTKPKPLDLTFHSDGSITGPGPVTIQGVVAAGYVSGAAGTNATQKDQYGNLYDAAGNRVPGNANTGYTQFAARTATCPALNLSSKGSSAGVQTMQTDLLKTMFGGDKGPPTPPGIRMHGIYAATTGFSVEFYPESAILGCGPDAARAYPYAVTATSSGAQIKIDAPDHPLVLAISADGSLAPSATGLYQVHGRVVTGQDQNDDFTFAPFEQTCNLAALAPSKTIPASGGTATQMSASTSATGAGSVSSGTANPGSGLSTPQAPLGNATLSVVSGFPSQAGVPNPLAGRPYLLLRSSYGDTLANAGITVPAGISPYKYVGTLCGNRQPDCQKASDAVKASVASAVRADVTGSGTFPGVPPGTYYLMISAIFNKQPLVWGQSVQIHSGANSIKLDSNNATPLN
ncbi:MAG TPA: hypothetical protein VGI45_03855 [Terracidiphilus sp.]|jgi:hypothetical protein